MMTAALVLFDLLLLVICVAFGEFPGFALWLVLSFAGWYARHALTLKAHALTLKAAEAQDTLTLKAQALALKAAEAQRRERKAREVSPRELPTAPPATTPPADVWDVRLKAGDARMTLDQLDALYQTGTIDERTLVRQKGDAWKTLAALLGVETPDGPAPHGWTCSCGTTTRPATEHCKACGKGEPITQRKCKQCGAVNDRDARFCDECGTDMGLLRDFSESMSASKTAPTAAPKRKRKPAETSRADLPGDLMVCRRCGTVNEPEDDRCSGCGRDLE